MIGQLTLYPRPKERGFTVRLGKIKNIEEGIPVLLRIYTHQQYGLRLDQTLDIEYGHMIISVNGNKNFSTLEDF